MAGGPSGPGRAASTSGSAGGSEGGRTSGRPPPRPRGPREGPGDDPPRGRGGSGPRQSRPRTTPGSVRAPSGNGATPLGRPRAAMAPPRVNPSSLLHGGGPRIRAAQRFKQSRPFGGTGGGPDGDATQRFRKVHQQTSSTSP